MKGVSYVVDADGKKRAVLVDLNEWGELWEDFHDVLVSKARQHEPIVPWTELRAEEGLLASW